MSESEEVIRNHLAFLLDEADAYDAAADKFKAAYDSCWNGDHGAGTGSLIDPKRALQLRVYVIDGLANARHLRKVHAALCEIIPPCEPDSTTRDTGGNDEK